MDSTFVLQCRWFALAHAKSGWVDEWLREREGEKGESEDEQYSQISVITFFELDFCGCLHLCNEFNIPALLFSRSANILCMTQDP